METHEKKAQLRETLATLTSKAYVQQRPKVHSALRELYEDIENDFYTIVVVGEFKRGKSTLVNALLGTKLLPMDVLPETATINAISYQEEPQLTVLLRDGTEKQGEVSYDFLRRYSARADNEETSSIQYIKIGYPCDLLKNRIILVDTPGVSDLSEQRSEVTFQFLPKANAILFVLDATSPLKRTEKEFIDNQILPLGIRNILFLVNKYDMVDEEEDDEDVLANVQKRILNAFQINEREAALKDISLLPISAKHALQAIETGNDKLLSTSGLPAIHQRLNEMLFSGNIEKEKVDGYQNRLSHLLSSLDRDIEREKAVRTAGMDELEKAADALRSLLSDRASEREEMNQYSKEFKNQIYAMTDKSLHFFGDKLREDVLEAIERHHSQNFKEFIEKDLTRSIKRRIETWIGTYTPHIDEFIRTLERELALGLSRHFKQQIHLRTAKGGALQSLDTMLNLQADDLSNTGFHAGAIAAIGAIGIMTVFSSVLVPILSFWGRSKIFDNLLSGRLEEAKRKISPQVDEQLAKVLIELSANIHKYIDERVSAVQNNTNHAYETILQEFQKMIQKDIEKKQTQESTLRTEVNAFENQQQELHRILKQIA